MNFFFHGAYTSKRPNNNEKRYTAMGRYIRPNEKSSSKYFKLCIYNNCERKTERKKALREQITKKTFKPFSTVIVYCNKFRFVEFWLCVCVCVCVMYPTAFYMMMMMIIQNNAIILYFVLLLDEEIIFPYSVFVVASFS